MAPKTISFPPTGDNKNKVKIPCCLNYNNGDTLSIAFGDSGALSDDNQAAFMDAIPTGKFGPNNLIGPYTPQNQNSQVDLTFKDSDTKQTFTYLITIQGTACPPTACD